MSKRKITSKKYKQFENTYRLSYWKKLRKRFARKSMTAKVVYVRSYYSSKELLEHIKF